MPAIPYLDGWRGIAILFVLFSHFFWPGYGWAGAMGVAIFFVLSGRLMSELLFVRQVSLADFFVRRFNRIVPLLWFFVVCMAVYSTAFQPIPYHVSLAELLATMVFSRTYVPDGLDIWADQWPIGHLWSLNVEEHSYVYLAAGAVICALAKMRQRAAVGFLAASTLLVLAINLVYLLAPPDGASPWIVRSECASLGLIAAGALCIARRTAKSDVLENVSPLFPVMTFLLAICCFKTYGHKEASRLIAPLALAVTVVYLDKIPAFLRDVLSTGILRWFGKCSFSLYLWQQPFYLLLERHRISAWSAAAATIVTATISFYLLDNRSRQWLNDRWARHRARVAARQLEVAATATTA